MRAVLCLILLSLLYSCKNKQSQSEKILAEFDSINKRLDTLNSKASQSNSALYDSLFKKKSESSFRQFYYTVTDCKGYLNDLKRRFIIACGDTAGILIPEKNSHKLSLTNDFFLENGPGKFLLLQLAEVQKTFLAHTADIELKQGINRLTEVPLNKKEDGFMKTYFQNVPPVAAMTILNKFTNDIENIEYRILKEYLNK